MAMSQMERNKLNEILRGITAGLEEMEALQSAAQREEELPPVQAPVVAQVSTSDATSRCPLCEFTTDSRVELGEHQAVHLNRGIQSVCRECSAGFPSAHLLREHQEAGRCRAGIFHCGRCGAMFPSEDETARHAVAAHGGNDSSPTQFCNQCGVDFGDQEQYFHHLRSSHAATRGGRPRARRPLIAPDRAAARERARSLNTIARRRARIKKRKAQIEMEFQLSREIEKNRKLEEAINRLNRQLKEWRRQADDLGVRDESE